jgi:hypothetical protein
MLYERGYNSKEIVDLYKVIYFIMAWDGHPARPRSLAGIFAPSTRIFGLFFYLEVP